MSQKHALIIEDEVNLTEIFSRVLDMANFQTDFVLSGDTASEQLAATVPDLIVLDLHLPRVSGQAILRQIKADRRLVNTKIIIVSADVATAQSLKHQADAVLFKPIGIHQLLNVVSDIFPTD